MWDHQGGSQDFYTPEHYTQEHMPRVGSPRGRLVVASCRSGSYFAEQVVGHYEDHLAAEGSQTEVLYLPDIDFQFSDSETCVRLNQHVAGYDVFLIQAVYDPTVERTVDENYMALFAGARALRENGAEHVTVVMPYLAYGRQDKPTRFEREPTTAKLMADMSITAGIDRLITWDPHEKQLRGFYGGIPVTFLDPLPLYIDIFREFEGRDDVIVVAPDAGASKLVTYFSRALGIRAAIASKFRPEQEKATITEIIGDFSGKRTAIVLDDMISSGGTVHQLISRLVTDFPIEEVHLAVSHNLCRPEAYDRIVDLHENYGLHKVCITDSIPQTEAFRGLPFVTEYSLTRVLSRVINRVHYKQSVSELFSDTIRKTP